MGAISMSCDNEATRGFGPAVGGHVKVDFGDADALAAVLEGNVVLQTLLELAYFILTSAYESCLGLDLHQYYCNAKIRCPVLYECSVGFHFWVLFSKLRIRSGGPDKFSVITEHGEKVAAFLFEPIQGEAGVSLWPYISV